MAMLFILLATVPDSTKAGRSDIFNFKEDDNNQVSKGPRGSLHPNNPSPRRRLQDMDSALSNGYGGSGGFSMTGQEPLDMRDSSGQLTPTVTPVGGNEDLIIPAPALAPTPDGRNITFLPGQLTVMERDLILSQGLTSTLIAMSGMPVVYANGLESAEDFHDWPDGAACFPDNRFGNDGGWIWVSNVEDKKGGVGAITFDRNGNVLNYGMILEDTTYNCNGGRTPWDTWISAEEDFDKGRGRPWQVDPYGVRTPETINMGNSGGTYEAFAYDARRMEVPRFFLTEDNVFGAMERFTPLVPDWTDPWTILTGVGVNEWLILSPNPIDDSFGTYAWTTDLDTARSNAGLYYPESEGVDVAGSNLFFVCKGIKTLFTLDLDGNTYTRQSTDKGLFEGEPDMVRTILSEEVEGETLLYFTEDNGRRAGIHARNGAGELVTIMEGFYTPETTGLAFSPDGMFMYVCFQEDGYCFAISRTDGLSFRAKTLNVKTHPTEVFTPSRKLTRKERRWL